MKAGENEKGWPPAGDHPRIRSGEGSLRQRRLRRDRPVPAPDPNRGPWRPRRGRRTRSRDRGIIAIAIAGLEDSGIAALAVLIAATEHRKELLHLGLVANLRDRLAAGMQVTALGERDQLLD